MKEVKTNLITLEVDTKEVNHNGQKFYGHTTYKKNGHKITLKFRRETENQPNATGKSFIIVDPLNMNICKSKKYDELWVTKIEGYKTDNELATEKAVSISEIF